MDANTCATCTAAAADSLAAGISQASALGVHSLLAGLLAVAAWALSTVWAQHLIELAIAKINPPFYIKALIPTALGSLGGMLLKASGVDAQTASLVAASWIGLVHAVNESPLAASLEGKYFSKIDGAISAAAEAAKTAKSAAVVFGLFGLLALAAGAHATGTDGATLLAPTTSAPTLGVISVSPTAGPLVISFEATTLTGSYRVGKGVVLAPSLAQMVNGCALANWGPYNVGLTGGVIYSADVDQWAGDLGVEAGFRGYGAVAVVWFNRGAELAWQLPISLGTTIKTGSSSTN